MEQGYGFERCGQVASLSLGRRMCSMRSARGKEREATGLPYNSHETGCRNVAVFCEEIDGFALVLNTRAVHICRSCISPWLSIRCFVQ